MFGFSSKFRLPLTRTFRTLWTGVWVGSKAILYDSEERQTSCSYRESNHDVSVLQLAVWSPHRLHHDGSRGPQLPPALRRFPRPATSSRTTHLRTWPDPERATKNNLPKRWEFLSQQNSVRILQYPNSPQYLLCTVFTRVIHAIA